MKNRGWKGVALAVVVVLIVALGVRVLVIGRERVLLAGDSILRQTGPALDDRFGWTTEVDNEAVNNSGLLTPGFVDWRERLEKQVEGDDPDVVVFLFIGNYTDDDFYEFEGQPVRINTPEFFEAWGHEADRLMEVLEDSDADVYWVLPPPQFTPENQATTDGLRQTYTELAERWPRIELIDSYDALAGPNGEYLTQTTNASGRTVDLRVGDTVHLSEAGARRLAGVIQDAIG